MADINEVSRVWADNEKQYWSVRDRSKTVLCANKAIADKLCKMLNEWGYRLSAAITINVQSGHWQFTSNYQDYCIFSAEGGVITRVASTTSDKVLREVDELDKKYPLPRTQGRNVTRDPDPEPGEQNEAPKPATTPNQPTTAEQATQEEEVMASNKIDIKSEAVEAGIRTSVTQVVKLLHEPLVALITAKLAVPGENPEAFAKRVAEFLKDDIGRAMVSGLLGLAFQNLPPAALASLGISGDMSERISRELRVNAMALVGGQVADLLMDPLRNVASGFAAQTGGKVRAVFEQNGIGVGVLNQEEESVPARDAVAKANEMAR